ncbi:hypothetical protein [Ruminococcus sp. HUN007]|uniref:hypothetical protein n=1 Tax=Ruminococcus sp. HUN007 TaxID=1514668 RepID=UPI0005D2AB1C|nr:hypothetical protein [Ruminococcus sp. HUN007]
MKKKTQFLFILASMLCLAMTGCGPEEQISIRIAEDTAVTAPAVPADTASGTEIQAVTETPEMPEASASAAVKEGTAPSGSAVSSLAEVAGEWNEADSIDAGTLIVSEDGTFTVSYPSGVEINGTVHIKNDETDKSERFYFYNEKGSLWCDFAKGTGPDENGKLREELRSGENAGFLFVRETESAAAGITETAETSEVTEKEAPVPNAAGFIRVTENPRPGTAGPTITALAGKWEDASGTVIEFKNCTPYAGDFEKTDADGTTVTAGKAYVEYNFDVDNYAVYWYNLYNENEELLYSFRFTGDFPVTVISDGISGFTKS